MTIARPCMCRCSWRSRMGITIDIVNRISSPSSSTTPSGRTSPLRRHLKTSTTPRTPPPTRSASRVRGGRVSFRFTSLSYIPSLNFPFISSSRLHSLLTPSTPSAFRTFCLRTFPRLFMLPNFTSLFFPRFPNIILRCSVLAFPPFSLPPRSICLHTFLPSLLRLLILFTFDVGCWRVGVDDERGAVRELAWSFIVSGGVREPA
ncbi:hypothetical protein B0H16DRAFT_512152 [Mycena metata]|uniref:Uncharacterized protein n=1 Tax=Mycena metata TaxID=1033252 RepID=A0AAD7MF88_9AGAR|nr:hypothetical protein B0H16DRAFT_512152 [Mycena metata]